MVHVHGRVQNRRMNSAAKRHGIGVGRSGRTVDPACIARPSSDPAPPRRRRAPALRDHWASTMPGPRPDDSHVMSSSSSPSGPRRGVRAAGALQGHPRRIQRSRPAHRLPDQIPHQSLGEVVEADTDRQRAHHDRLQDELRATPCSPRCAVWLLYGVQPLGANSRMTPGTAKDGHIGGPRSGSPAGACSCRESGPARLSPTTWLMHAISERIRWRAEYDKALLAAGEHSATQQQAA